MPEFVRALSPSEEAAIQELLRSRTVPAGYYVRALIIHFSRQGETPAQIARRLEHKFDNVVKWIRRFNEEGLAGLNERPGRGRKAKIQASEALAVVETVLTPPA
jgi:transposase